MAWLYLGEQTGRWASALSVRDGLPLSDRLDDRRRVAQNEKAAKVNLAGPWFLAGRRRRTQAQMQTRGAVWQLRPDAPIAPQPVGLWAGRPNSSCNACNAPALRCRLGVDSPDLVLVQLLVLTLHKVQSTEQSTEHRVPILPHPTNNKSPPLPPCPRAQAQAQPHSGNTPILIACWFDQRPAPADIAIGLRWMATRSTNFTP